MKTSNILISTFIAAAAMTAPAYADFVWNGGQTITAELWATQSSWDLTDGTSWTGLGDGPQTPDSNSWAPIVVANAKGEIGNLEGWAVDLTLTNANLTVNGLKKFQNETETGEGCTVSIDANSTLTINNFGYTTGNDGESVYLNNEGTFNLQLAKNQSGEGFVMNLGSTGVVNVSCVSGSHTVKVTSVSATLERDDFAKNAASGKTTLTRQLINFSDGASFDSTPTAYSLEGTEGIFTFNEVDSLEGAAVGTYTVSDDGSVSYVVYNGELKTWAGTEGNSTWDTTSTNWSESSTFTDGGSAVFGEGDSLAKTVSVNSDISATYVSVQDDYTFAIGDGAKLSAGTVQIADGKTLSLSGAGTFAVTDKGGVASISDISSFSGTLEVAEGARISLTTASAGVTLNATGAGTLAVVLTDTYSNTISVGSDFTGTVDVTSGNFSINNVSVPGALVIEDGVKFQANGNTAVNYAGDLVINGTTHEMHANSGSSLTFSGRVSGDRYVARGSGSVYFTGTVELDSFTTGETQNDTGSVVFSGTTTINSMTLSHGRTYTLSGDTTLGTLTQSAGTINISGGTTITGNYTGGNNAASTISVQSGASLDVDGDFTLHYEYNQLSLLNVAGTMSVGGNLWIARDGMGEVNINDGGTLTAGTLTFGQNAGWSSNDPDAKHSYVNVNSGGTLAVGSITATTTLNTPSLNLNGGTLGTTADSLSISVADLPVVLGEGTKSTISTSKFENGAFGDAAVAITISDVISGTGALVADGAGTLTLSGANTFSGGVEIVAGTVIAEHDSALGDSNGLVTLSGGQLSIAESVTLNQAAITIALGSAYESAAAIIGDGLLAEGTVITLTKADEAALALVTETSPSYSYKIFEEGSSLAGSFDENAFTLGEGWTDDAWTLSYSNGWVTIAAIPEPSAFGLLAGVGVLALVAARRRRSRK